MARPQRRPSNSSPPLIQHHDLSPDTSLSASDKSLRSMQSAPSLTSASTAVSNQSINVHLIPLPHSHLHIHSGDDSIDYSDDGSHKILSDDFKSRHSGDVEDTVRIIPMIAVTPSQERLEVHRMESDRTVVASVDNGDPGTPQMSEHDTASDTHTEDDAMTEESVGVTEELRRTLFYRPSTDPTIITRTQPPDPTLEQDLELSDMLNTTTNLLSLSPDTTGSGPPTRPPRPPSLHLSDTDEPKPKPKSVDLVRPGTAHSRMSSRERLGAMFGAKGNRASFAGRSSLGYHSQAGSTSAVLPLSIKGKSPVQPLALFPGNGERVVEVRQVDTGLARERTISEKSAAEMDRSVWEDDDTEELGTAWGLVRKWLTDENRASTSTQSSKKQKQGRHPAKSLSLGSTISAFRTPPTSPAIRDSVLGSTLRDSSALLHENSGPAIRESSVLGLHESSLLGSTSTIHQNDHWANTSTSRASFQTANASFHTQAETKSTSFKTADARSSLTVSDFHSLSGPSSQSLGGSRRSFQSRRLGPRASVGSSLASLAEPPESPTMTPMRIRSESVGEQRGTSETERPRSRLLVVPEPESRPLFVEPEPQKVLKQEEVSNPVPLPSPPSSPSPSPRGPTTTARSLHNPTYPSLHKRIGSLVHHSTPKSRQYGPVPSSPLWSPSPSSPARSQTPASPRWAHSPTGSLGSPLGMSMNMDRTYVSDVRPISGITESTYYGRGSAAGTAGRPDSGATWAGSQRGLLAPPPVRTVRIVDSPARDRRVRSEDGLQTPPPSASRSSSTFRLSNSGPGPRNIRRQSVEYEAGLSPAKWFALGFVLGPWCWFIGGWMLDGRNRVVGVVGDAEKGMRVGGEQWVWRCRVASVVSGVAVFGCALAAIVYAILGAR